VASKNEGEPGSASRGGPASGGGAIVAGTIGAQPRNGSHAEAAPHAGALTASAGALRVVRAIGEAGAWPERRTGTAGAPRTQLSTREWLARAAFSLLAVTVLLAIVLTALSLLDGAEAAGLLLPVVALSAIVVGFYLGSEAAGEGRRGRS
jgi:hypothetical protein